MGTYYCPGCFRPEGEFHKSNCQYDEGGLVSWYDREEELQLEHERSVMDSEELLDGMCDADMNPERPTADNEIDGIVLFADLAQPGSMNVLGGIEERKEEWRRLFNA